MVYVGYIQSQGDRTLFIKHLHGGKLTLPLIFVDYMIIVRNDDGEKQMLKEKLATQFKLKRSLKIEILLRD